MSATGAAGAPPANHLHASGDLAAPRKDEGMRPRPALLAPLSPRRSSSPEPSRLTGPRIALWMVAAGLLAATVTPQVALGRPDTGSLSIRWAHGPDPLDPADSTSAAEQGSGVAPAGPKRNAAPVQVAVSRLKIDESWQIAIVTEGATLAWPATLGGERVCRELPVGSCRLELRNPDGHARREFEVPILSELTTQAYLDLDRARLAVSDVHPDPFGDVVAWSARELSLLPGLGIGAIPFSPPVPGRVDAASLDGWSLRHRGQNRERDFRLERTVESVAARQGEFGASRASAERELGTATAGHDRAQLGLLASGGSAGRAFGQARLSGRWGGEEMPAWLAGLGLIDGRVSFQGLSFDDASGTRIADGSLDNNDLSSLEMQIRLALRPGAAGQSQLRDDDAPATDRLLRFGLYAYGQRRRYFLQEFREANEHTPREERSQLQAHLDYSFDLGPMDLLLAAGYDRSLIETGDGRSFDALTRYRTNDNAATDPLALYWRGDNAATGIDEAHLYDYYQRDYATAFSLRAEGTTMLGVASPLRVGGEANLRRWRYFEHLEPTRSILGINGGGYEFASYLGYRADGEVHAEGGDHDAPNPKTLSLYAAQRLPAGPAVLELGARVENYRSGADPLSRFEDILADGSNLTDANYGERKSHTALLPRAGAYWRLDKGTSLWADVGASRNEPPYVASYVSSNLLQSFAFTAHEREMPFGSDFVFGNPALAPEERFGGHAGLARRLSRSLDLRLAGRLAETSETFVARRHSQGVDDLAFYENGGKRRERGGHATVLWQRGRHGRVRLDYDLSRVETNAIEPWPLYAGILFPEASAQSPASPEWAAPSTLVYDDGVDRGFFPSIFDRTHLMSAAYSTRFEAETGGFSALLPNWDFGLSARAASGRPYTRTFLRSEGEVASIRSSAEPVDPFDLNSERMPWTFQLDAVLVKETEFFGQPFELRFEGLNLTDHRNAVRVYGATGKADDDGWLESAAGQAAVAARGAEYEEAYRDRIDNPRNFDDGLTLRVRAAWRY